jgi:hypothetical protein
MDKREQRERLLHKLRRLFKIKLIIEKRIDKIKAILNQLEDEIGHGNL